MQDAKQGPEPIRELRPNELGAAQAVGRGIGETFGEAIGIAIGDELDSINTRVTRIEVGVIASLVFSASTLVAVIVLAVLAA